jgi:hypothetical protein
VTSIVPKRSPPGLSQSCAVSLGMRFLFVTILAREGAPSSCRAPFGILGGRSQESLMHSHGLFFESVEDPRPNGGASPSTPLRPLQGAKGGRPRGQVATPFRAPEGVRARSGEGSIELLRSVEVASIPSEQG